ncbi:MAG: transketolase C-terminal domain-containing protein, partial [Acidimicrobiales bacterium]
FFYVGPIDGHNLDHLLPVLKNLRDSENEGPVLVHVVTQKGHGYGPAEAAADKYHGVVKFDVATGAQVKGKAAAPSYTSVYAKALIAEAERDPRIVAITAAMPSGTGLDKFAERFPNRSFDVGIAEQHAVTSAAGLALGGLHPVVSLYSTFLNRAFDQLLMDVALLRVPVTITLDRAGVTGDDGASHNGMWDLSVLGIVPGIRVAAPRDAATLREELAEAVAVADGPTAVRFPKGPVIEAVPALERVEGVDVLFRPALADGDDVLLVGVGVFAELAVAAAGRLADQGIGVTVVDPRWVLPVPAALVRMAARHRLVVSVEDGGRHGGFGWSLAAALRDAEIDVPCRDLGIPQRFLAHGSRD